VINIESIAYRNENGELVTINFEDTDIEYRADRIHDLVREMISAGKLGPPPKNKPDGDTPAWMGE
jgi:hypothetical protein